MRRSFSQLIQAGELSALLKSGKKVHVLEAGFPATRAIHFKTRIASAAFFDIEEISDPKTSFPYMLADQETFRQAMRELQIPNDDSLVVCYDRSGLIAGCRVWWNLKVYGRKNVAVLDGGLPQWLQLKGETHTGEYQIPASTEEGGYDYKLDSTHYSPFETVQTISMMLTGRSPQTLTQIVDLRPPAKFLGLETEPTPGLRGGNIPGSINLPASRLLTEKRKLQSKEVLTAVFKDAGVSLDERCPTIFTCQTGITATLGMFAMMSLGKNKVSVYDGSWSEFGMRTSEEAESMTSVLDMLKSLKESQEALRKK